MFLSGRLGFASVVVVLALSTSGCGGRLEGDTAEPTPSPSTQRIEQRFVGTWVLVNLDWSAPNGRAFELREDGTLERLREARAGDSFGRVIHGDMTASLQPITYGRAIKYASS
ncbi:MAG TPA: hypothetical protein VM925_09190 [Labilithrix sp.]|nr:hypothetical protein [Labilithrix sp.]